MICMVLAAGYATRLYPLTENFPKPLLKVREKPILDWLVDDIETSGAISRYVVISNHKYAPHFEAWARTKSMPIDVLDDGTLSNETRLGAVRDIQFAIDALKLDDDLLVIAGDNVLDFSLARFIAYAQKKKSTCVMRYYEPSAERLRKSGVLKIDRNDLILDMTEKPDQPESHWCCPPFYYYTRADAGRVAEGIAEGCSTDAPGCFIAWLCRQSPVHAMEMPGKRYDIGDLKSYEVVQESYRGIAKYAPLNVRKKILITGAAGFVGFHLVQRLLEQGMSIIGYDNVNDYYDVRLKYARLDMLKSYPGFAFVKGDLADQEAVNALFISYEPDIVVNLAAQAGVRYSITNPRAYIDSNIVGFLNILEACRHHPVEHLLYASSSSVYGNQQKTPFSTDDDVSKPISLYAATKKSNELMAFTYSHLYGIPTTGLRFFTVYGPYGRPDMAYFSFTNKLVKGETIQIYNNGDMKRDFTYVDDIVQGIENMLCNPPMGEDPAKVYNIGNNQPEDLLHFVETLERCLMAEGVIQQPAKKEFLPMQPGDVYQTYADVGALMHDFDFKPSTSIEAGLSRFAKWYKAFYSQGGLGV